MAEARAVDSSRTGGLSSGVSAGSAALHQVLEQLNVVAEDRIRDAKAAKSLLAGLIKAVKAVRKEDAPVPADRIVRRLCYFANARDTAIRSATFRALRYVVARGEDARCVMHTRMIISLVRSLEREPRYLWERIQALKVVRVVIELAPEDVSMAVLRSLVAIATFVADVPAPAAVSSRSLAAAAPRAGARAAPDRAVNALNDGEDGGGGEDDAEAPPPRAAPPPAALRTPAGRSATSTPTASAAPAPVDNLRRVVLDTLRLGCLSPRLLPMMAASGAIDTLVDSLLDLAQSPPDQDVCASLLLTFARLVADPYARTFLPPSRILHSLAAVFTFHFADVPVTLAHRARWAAARHLLVALSRTWAGLYALATETHTLQALVAMLLTCQQSDVVLSVCGIVTELLLPPALARTARVHELSGYAPAARRMEHTAIGHIFDDASAQALAVSYYGSLVRLQAAASSVSRSPSGTVRRELSYAELELNAALATGASSGAADGLSASAIAGIVAGEFGGSMAVAEASAADAASTPAAIKLPPYLRPAGFAVPYFASEHRHGVEDETEYHASFWLRLRDCIPSAALQTRAAMHVEAEAAVKCALDASDVWSNPMREAAATIQAATTSPWPSPVLSTASLTRAYQAHMLTILLRAGLARGCVAVALRSHPVVHIAGLSLLHMLSSLSLQLLPSHASTQLWGMADLVQLSATVAARVYVSSPMLGVHLGVPPLHARSMIAAYTFDVHALRDAAGGVKVLLQAAPHTGRAADLCAEPIIAAQRQQHVHAVAVLAATQSLSRTGAHSAKWLSAPPSPHMHSAGDVDLPAAASMPPLRLTDDGAPAAAAAPADAPVACGAGIPPAFVAQVRVLRRLLRRRKAREIDTAAQPSEVYTHGTTHDFRHLHRNATNALELLTTVADVGVPSNMLQRISRGTDAAASGLNAVDLGFSSEVATHTLMGTLPGSMLESSEFAERVASATAEERKAIMATAPVAAHVAKAQERAHVRAHCVSVAMAQREVQVVETSRTAYAAAHVSSGIGIAHTQCGHALTASQPAAAGVAGRLLLPIHSRSTGVGAEAAGSRAQLIAVAHFDPSAALSAASRAFTALRSISALYVAPTVRVASRQHMETTLAALVQYATDVHTAMAASVSAAAADAAALSALSSNPTQHMHALVQCSSAGIASAAVLQRDMNTFLPHLSDTHALRAGMLLLYYAIAAAAVAQHVAASSGVLKAAVPIAVRPATTADRTSNLAALDLARTGTLSPPLSGRNGRGSSADGPDSRRGAAAAAGRARSASTETPSRLQRTLSGPSASTSADGTGVSAALAPALGVAADAAASPAPRRSIEGDANDARASSLTDALLPSARAARALLAAGDRRSARVLTSDPTPASAATMSAIVSRTSGDDVGSTTVGGESQAKPQSVRERVKSMLAGPTPVLTTPQKAPAASLWGSGRMTPDGTHVDSGTARAPVQGPVPPPSAAPMLARSVGDVGTLKASEMSTVTAPASPPTGAADTWGEAQTRVERSAPPSTTPGSRLSTLMSGLTRGITMAFTPRQDRASSITSIASDATYAGMGGAPQLASSLPPRARVASITGQPSSASSTASGGIISAGRLASTGQDMPLPPPTTPATAASTSMASSSRLVSGDEEKPMPGSTVGEGGREMSGLSRALAKAASARMLTETAAGSPFGASLFRSASAKALRRIMPISEEASETLDVSGIALDGSSSGGGVDSAAAMTLSPDLARRRRRQFQTIKLGFISHVREDERAIDWEDGVSRSRVVRNNELLLALCMRRLSVRMDTASMLCVLRRVQMRVTGLPSSIRSRRSEANEPLVPPSVMVAVDASAGLHTAAWRDMTHVANGAAQVDIVAATSVLYDQAYHSCRSGGRPLLSSLLRAQALSPLSTFGRHIAYSAGNTAANAAAAAARGTANKERDIGMAAQVSAAFSLIRVSKVIAAKDWRTWDWGTIAVLLDHHLTTPTVLGEVLVKIPFMQRLGEFFSHVGSTDTLASSGGSLASLPWLPSTLKFVRAARQWLLLCMHHPLGRDMLRHRASSRADGQGQGLVAEVAVALWCTLSRTYRVIVKGNSGAGKVPATPSSAAGRFLASATSRARAALLGPTSAPQAEGVEQAAAASVRDFIGSTTNGDAHASVFARATFTTTLAREMMTLLGALSSAPSGMDILSSIKAATVFTLADAPNHTALLEALLRSSSTPSLGVVLKQSNHDFLLSLAHLADHPSREYLARHLLGCLSFASDGAAARLLLRAWMQMTRPPARRGGTALGEDAYTDAATVPPGFTVSKGMALYATCFMRVLLRQGVPGFAEWGIELLVQQLQHDDEDLRAAAVSILAEAALQSRVYLLSIIARRPALDNVPLARCSPLLMLMLTEPTGCVAVAALGHLQDAMDAWLACDHVRYAMLLESSVTSAFSTNGMMLDEVTPSGVAMSSVDLQRAALARHADALLPRTRALTRTLPSADAARAMFAVHGNERTDRLYRDDIFLDGSRHGPQSLAWMHWSSIKRMQRNGRESQSGGTRTRRSVLRRASSHSPPHASASAPRVVEPVAPVPAPVTPHKRASRHSHHAGMEEPTAPQVVPSPAAARQHVKPAHTATASGVHSFSPALPQPWPVPIVLPPSPSEVMPGVQPLYQQLAASDPAFTPQLHALMQLPWRVEVWAEWEKVAAPASRGANNADGSWDGSPSPAASSSTPITSLPAAATRQTMRMEIACDTFVDLSTFQPEACVLPWGGPSSGSSDSGPSSAGRVRCDGMIRALCVGSQGVPHPFEVPPSATIKAALYCGVHPVSAMGDIPRTATEAGSSSTLPRREAFSAQPYDDPATILNVAASLSRWDEESPRIEKAPSTGSTPGTDRDTRNRVTRARGDGRQTSRRTLHLDSHAEGTDDEDEEASGDGVSDGARSERSASSRRQLLRAQASSAGSSRRISGGTIVVTSLTSSDADMTSSLPAALINDGVILEDATTRLRRRNAAAVGSLSLEVQRRHAHAWAAESGLVEVEGGVAVKPASLNFADVVLMPGAASTSAVMGVTKLPDYVAGGPEANTVITSASVLATHAPAQAGAIMRAAGDRHACWSSCRVGDAVNELFTRGQRGDDVPERSVIAPPGSNARFTFATSILKPGSVFLEAVEIGITLLPKRMEGLPLPLNLYASLAAHKEGAAILRASGHIPALVQVAFDTVLPAHTPTAAAAAAVESVSMQRRAAVLGLTMMCSAPLGYAAVVASVPDFLLRMDAAARGLRLVTATERVSPGHVAMSFTAHMETEDDSALRAACQYGLGLIARHELGYHDVSSYGWWVRHAPRHMHEQPPSLAVLTTDVTDVIIIPQQPVTAYTLRGTIDGIVRDAAVADAAPAALDDVDRPGAFLSATNLPPRQREWEPVLARVAELCSRISQREARTALVKLRSERGELFASAGLYMHVHALLSRYNMALPVRRFIHFLFERVSFSDRAWEAPQ